MDNEGLTLMELIIVTLVIGVLAIVGLLPDLTKVTERHKGKEAEVNLELIYNAEKRYYLDNGSYFICNKTPCTVNELKDSLSIDPARTYFTYAINGNSTLGFTALATRTNEGICVNKTMNITEGGGPVQKGCSAW